MFDRTRRALAVDIALIALLLAMLALPLAAAVTVRGAGIAPPGGSGLPPLGHPATVGPRDLPIFTNPAAGAVLVRDGRIRTDAARVRTILAATWAATFPGSDWAAVEAAIDDIREPLATTRPNGSPYPITLPRLDPILDALPAAATGAVNDLAAQLTLAAAGLGDDLPGAGSLAAALLQRHGAGCEPQLNLLLLLTMDAAGMPIPVLTGATLRAEAACPKDPTPRYLLGQAMSDRIDMTDSGSDPQPRAVDVGYDAAHVLQRRFPGSPAGWTLEADLEVTLADQASVNHVQPFTARHRYERAVDRYRRAAALSDDPGIGLGVAHALTGLARYREAAGELATSREEPALVRPLLGVALERDHRFADAVPVARQALAAPEPAAPRSWLLGPGAGAGHPLSYAGGRTSRVSVTVGPPPGGRGAGAGDASFIPAYREGPLTRYDWSEPDRIRLSLARDLVLAGQPDAAMQAARPLSPQEVDAITSVARPAVAVRAESTSSDGPTNVQNLYRFAGDLAKAAAAAADWIRADDASGDAWEQAGEIAYLQKRYPQAADRFAGAADRYRRAATDPDEALTNRLCAARSQLKRGAALDRAGQTAPARDALTAAGRESAEIGRLAVDSRDVGTEDVAVVSYHAHSQLGLVELRAGRYPQAADAFAAARPELATFTFGSAREARRAAVADVLDNNAALVAYKRGHADEAVAGARAALVRDPDSPVYLHTMALAADAAGDRAGAIAAYRQALDADGSLFPAANNLGVLLARSGRPAEAVTAFRRAVGADPGYATGWFNLGVALHRLGPAHLLESEGALGKAGRLDPQLRGVDRQYLFDQEPYPTTLDLSKPLPANWQFSRSYERTAVSVSLLLVALLVIRLLWTLGLDKIAEAAADRAVGWLPGGRLGFLRRRPLAVVAVAVTVGLAVWPAIGTPDFGVADAALLALGVLVLVAACARARTVVARRRGVTTRTFTSLPAVGFGVAMTAVGLGFYPLPAVETDDERPVTNWVAPAVLGALGAVLLLLAWQSGTPSTRAFGASAVVMLGSVMTPVKPFDGAYVSRRPVEVAVDLVLVVVAVLLFLHVV